MSVVICDDHDLIRKAIADRLESDGRFRIVGKEATGEACAALLGGLDADVAIIDIELPGMDGFSTTTEVLGQESPAKVVVLSAHDDPGLIEQARSCGASAFISKADALDGLVDTIAEVAEADGWVQRTGQDGIPDDGTLERLLRLTAREREILDLFAGGLRAAQVAEQLGIGRATVYTHARNAANKLGVRTRSQAVAIAIRYGYVDSVRPSAQV